MMLLKKHRDATELVTVILLMLCILVILIYGFASGISGNDFWWHIKVGEYVMEHHTVPTTDIFSWAGMERNISWTAHEWLSDVVYYWIYSIFGVVGIFLFCLLSAVSLIVLIWWQRNDFFKKNPMFFGLYLTLLAVLCGVLFYGRPHVFSFFFLFFALKILFRFWENNDSKSIFLLPVLTVFWSNLHGGASNLAYLLPLIFLVVGCLNFDCGRLTASRLSKKGRFVLCIISLLCILGIFINPIGWRVFLYPYVSFADNLMMTVIQEWESPDAKKVGQLILYFFPIMVMSVGIITQPKKVRLIDIVVMVIFLFLFFRSVRFIMFWFIAAAFYTKDYVPEWKIKPLQKTWEGLTCLILAIFMLVLIGTGIRHTVATAKSGALISVAMESSAVDFVKKEAPKRLFNDYNLGETLIYNEVQTFVDARADLFAQEHLLEDAISLMYLSQANSEVDVDYVDVERLIEKYQFDGFLILNTRPLYAYLISHPQRFDCVYGDDTVSYFRVIRQ